MTDASCTCGHAIEEHGRDPEYPASTACSRCDCIAYDAQPDDDAMTESERRADSLASYELALAAKRGVAE